MNKFGLRIKGAREGGNIQLRKVAAYLDIDQAILSKIERGHRKAKREQVEQLAAFFDIDKEELLVDWLADKIIKEVEKDDLAMRALLVAEEEIEYKIIAKADRAGIIKKLKLIIDKYPQVNRAWIFGSFASADHGLHRDIDVLIDVSQDVKFTQFNISEIREKLENAVAKKVNLRMLNEIRPDMKKRIENEVELIYEAG